MPSPDPPGPSATAEGRFPYIVALTPLRFLAAFGVLLHHMRPRFPDLAAALAPAAPYLASGVSFFFVLSGFVIAWSLRLEKPGWRDFMTLRAARIYPVAWLGLAILLGGPALLHGANIIALRAATQGWPETAASLALGLLLLQSWVPNQAVVLNMNGPAWSLSTEMFFYACAPAILALGRRGVLLFALPASAALVALCIAIEPAMHGFTDGGFPLVHFFPPARLFEFVIGVAAAHLARPAASRLPPALVRLGPNAIAIAGTGALIAVALVVRSLAGLAPAPALRLYLFQAGGGPAYGAVILALAAHQLASGRASTLYAAPLLQRLGHASFALYAIHVPLMVALRLPAWWLVPPLVIAAALIVHRWLETPMVAMAKRRLRRRGEPDRTGARARGAGS